MVRVVWENKWDQWFLENCIKQIKEAEMNYHSVVFSKQHKSEMKNK